MAEAVVNIVVEQLISATTEWLKEEISMIDGVEEELQNMSTKMQTIQHVLDDAQNQSMKKKIVKERLEKLEDISYDMEDVMDEWNTRVLMQKMEDASNEISCFSYKKFNCFSTTIKQVGWRRDLAWRIRRINGRMNMIFAEIESLNLISKVLGHSITSERIINVNRVTTSSIEESHVHGRDDDKKYLLHKVLCRTSDEHNDIRVIPILGVGGLGKTTLAQLVYNDEKVRDKFNHTVWVCVSNPFDEVKVAQGILEGIKVYHKGLVSLQSLHESIKESVYEKKLLIVLDDVWEENSGKWERLRMCLKFGARESRIIVTTRSEEVAKIMSSKPTNIFKPALISNSDCWLLMCQVAFQGKGEEEEDRTELKDIGKRIASKCKGLALAAKVLGGLLRAKDTLEEWEEVLNSEIWGLDKAEMELFPHFFLSYKELSPSLKRCFSLCSLFPKDHSISVEKLIPLWMSQIYIDSRTIKGEVMLTGKKYISFLKSRAFLEEGIRSNSVKMHDIMHDFAFHLSGHEFLSLVEVDNRDSSEPQAYPKNMKARHLFVSGTINPASYCDVGKLRTCYITRLPQDVTLDLFKQLKVVRALYLQLWLGRSTRRNREVDTSKDT